MDDLDRRILRVLQRRADTNQADLAEQVGSSPASVWRRIRAMEDSGVLGPQVRLLNRTALNCPLDVICQVRMRAHDLDARAEFERFIEGRDEVVECFSMSGEWDYLLRVVTSTAADYERFLMRELLGNKSVATSASHFVLRGIKYTTALPI